MKHKSAEISNSALTLFVVVLLLIFSMIGFYLGLDSGRDRVAKTNAQVHHENAFAQIDQLCADRNFPKLIECIQKVLDTSGEQQLAEFDLAAQQEVAEWTKWVLVVSVVSSFITMVGIYFVWLTFGEARKTNNIAMEVGQAQVRAYISLGRINTTFNFNRSGFVTGLVLQPNFKNTGQSPGIIVSAFFDTQWSDAPDTYLVFNVKHRKITIQASKIGASEDRDFDAAILDIKFVKENFKKGKHLVLAGIVRYTDVFSQVLRDDQFCSVVIFNKDFSEIDRDNLPGHKWRAYPNYKINIEKYDIKL